MALFNVPKEEWAIANHTLSKALPGTKMRKKITGLAHSFIKFKDKIVAIGKKLGEGSFGIVKQAQDQLENHFAVKVQGGPIDADDKEEETIGEEMDFAYDMVERKLEIAKKFYENTYHEITTNTKKYALLKYLDGNDLVYELYDKKAYHEHDALVRITKLSPVQKLIIAIQVCQLLKKLQQHRIIHADLKPENLKVIINGNNIKVYLMDFGFSMHLPRDKTFITSIAKGSPGYIAPEIFNPLSLVHTESKFSFESDIYATGIMFRDDFQLDTRFHEGMTKADPSSRESVDVVMAKLLSALEASTVLDKDALDFIQSIKKPPTDVTTKPIQKPGNFNPAQIRDVMLKPAAPQHKTTAQEPINLALNVKLRPAPKAKAEATQQPVPMLKQTLRPVPKMQEPAKPAAGKTEQRTLPPLVLTKTKDENRSPLMLPPGKKALAQEAGMSTAVPATDTAKHAVNIVQPSPQAGAAAQVKRYPVPALNKVLPTPPQPQTRIIPVTKEVVTKNPVITHSNPLEQTQNQQAHRQDAAQGVAPSMRKRVVVVLPGQKTEIVSRAKANLLIAFEKQAQRQDAYIPKGGVVTPLTKINKVK